MLEDILQSKKSLFDTGMHTELRAQENRERWVRLSQGSMVYNGRSEVSGVCARVGKNGLYGFASAAGCTSENAEAVLSAATKNALFMNRHISKDKIVIPSLTGGYIPVNKVIADIGQKRAIELCREIDNYVVKKYPELSGRSVMYSEDSMEKILCTSDGKDGHTTGPRCYIYVQMSSQSDSGEPVEIFKAFGGSGCFEDNFEDISYIFEGIDRLYEALMKKKDGIYPEAGVKTVILGGMMTGMLAHEAVGHTTEADLVRGGSVAGPALGKRVASEKVSMTDFAHTAFGKQAPLPIYLDDEGVEATDAELIKDGILTGYMNNRESALQFDMRPCGNARAHMYSDEPLIRMRNTAVLPGTDKLEDMIASVEDGYYLVSSNNGQADLTGEFMFGVTEGYEIKHGRLGRAILETTISGVAFDMLKTVDMVSDEVIWSSSGYCGKKQSISVGMGGPALRCQIMIGGR